MGECADPDECKTIADLGVDMLAAGIGNIHGKYPANWKGLSFETLDAIQAKTGVCLLYTSNVEYTFIQQMSDAEKKTRYDAFLKFDIPCVIFCRSLQPDEIFLEEAIKNEVPVLGTDRPTSEFMAELIYTLGEELAPCITVHGVLVDVYGEGLMITGDSGIGKSEAALELIRRGHRLVTDDVVEIRKINEHTLIGTSPEVTRHFIELRGIGIIDVKTLYGVELSLIHI